MSTYAQRALRQASFCGVPFNVKSTSIRVGRRTALFEYPQRDKPFVEDMGRAASEVTVTAFVTGNTYVAKMGALIDKLENKGTGELVDPWLGRMKVTAQATSEVKYSSRLCYAEVTITFIETGDLTFPSAAANTTSAVLVCADSLRSAACDCLAGTMALDGAQDFVVAALSGHLNDLTQIPELQAVAQIFGCADQLADFAADAASLLAGSSTEFAYRLAGAFGLGAWASSTASWRRVAHLLTTVTSDRKLEKARMITYQQGTQDYIEATSADAINAAVRQVTISNLIGATAAIGTDKDRVTASAAGSTLAYDDLIAARDEALAAIDAEMVKTDNDEIFAALQDARAAVWEDLTTRAEDKARLLTVTPPAVMPALVLAYDRYEDATRELEIVERNRISRSAFLPARPLKLLSA